jgi:hypothetical protein
MPAQSWRLGAVAPICPSRSDVPETLEDYLEALAFGVPENARSRAMQRRRRPLLAAGGGAAALPNLTSLDYRFSTPEDAGRIVADLGEERADIAR